jgi:hypothetical protein
MTIMSRYFRSCHCEPSPTPHGVQGEAKQSLISDATIPIMFKKTGEYIEKASLKYTCLSDIKALDFI